MPSAAASIVPGRPDVDKIASGMDIAERGLSRRRGGNVGQLLETDYIVV